MGEDGRGCKRMGEDGRGWAMGGRWVCDGWEMVYLVVEDVHEARRLEVEDDALRVPVDVLKRLVAIGAGRVHLVDALRARAGLSLADWCAPGPGPASIAGYKTLLSASSTLLH